MSEIAKAIALLRGYGPVRAAAVVVVGVAWMLAMPWVVVLWAVALGARP